MEFVAYPAPGHLPGDPPGNRRSYRDRLKSGHRTFSITIAKSGKLEGKRIVGLLEGSNNETDYRGFGFVNEDGSVYVWRKFQGTAFDKHAAILSRSGYFAETHGLLYAFETTCRKCDRKLTTPESIAAGIGPVCAAK